MVGFALGSLGATELILILAIILIIFGPGKLPQVGQQMGKAIKSFRQAKEADFEELEEEKVKK